MVNSLRLGGLSTLLKLSQFDLRFFKGRIFLSKMYEELNFWVLIQREDKRLANKIPKIIKNKAALHQG